jgi:hypothetical protein
MNNADEREFTTHSSHQHPGCPGRVRYFKERSQQMRFVPVTCHLLSQGGYHEEVL